MKITRRHVAGITTAAVAAGLAAVTVPGTTRQPLPRSPTPRRSRSCGRAPPWPRCRSRRRRGSTCRSPARPSTGPSTSP